MPKYLLGYSSTKDATATLLRFQFLADQVLALYLPGTKVKRSDLKLRHLGLPQMRQIGSIWNQSLYVCSILGLLENLNISNQIRPFGLEAP